jgi:hypothetical protein
MYAEVCCYRCTACHSTYDDEDEAEDCCTQYATDDMDIWDLSAVGERVYQDWMQALELAGQMRLKVAATNAP